MTNQMKILPESEVRLSLFHCFGILFYLPNIHVFVQFLLGALVVPPYRSVKEQCCSTKNLPKEAFVDVDSLLTQCFSSSIRFHVLKCLFFCNQLAKSYCKR